MTLNSSLATPIRLDSQIQPMLAVVVDTEEEFDWSAPFSRNSRATTNMREQFRAQAILQEHAAVPTYVIDHPVATDTWAAAWLRETMEAGLCEVGAHLHTWVTPPYDEAVSARNSYGCNLDPALEKAKIEMLTDTVADAMGQRPTQFRAGRYGVGSETLSIIQQLGYRCDLSLVPHSSFTADGGPEFYDWRNTPYWFGKPGDLLCLPVTTGFSGIASGLGPHMARTLDTRLARSLHFPGMLAKFGLMDRSRLTIEGVTADALRRLMASLVGSGERLLTLSYHSSSLLPGATGYARTETERNSLIECLDETLGYFTEVLGGRIVAVSEAETIVRTQKNA